MNLSFLIHSNLHHIIEFEEHHRPGDITPLVSASRSTCKKPMVSDKHIMKKLDTILILRSYLLLYGCTLLVLVGCASTHPNQKDEEKPAGDQVDVGYGSVDKNNVVGSVVTVDAKDAQVVKPASVADMLRGRASGVQVTDLPGGGIRVRIRGSRSLRGSNDPLYVIDGMVIQTVDGALRGINPLDIDTISVLKDASATAIYGSRGSNGVILIKTKRGK